MIHILNFRKNVIMRQYMNRRKLLRKFSTGSFTNVSFNDATSIVESFGFSLSRIPGIHRVFSHPDTPELLNLQEHEGQAKPYQLRQFLRLVEKYNLSMEDETQ